MDYETAKKKLLEAKPDIQLLNYRVYKDGYIFQTAPREAMIWPLDPVLGGYYFVTEVEVTPVNPKADSSMLKEPAIDLTGYDKVLDEIRANAQ